MTRFHQLDTNNDGMRQNGEAGIAGVAIILSGSDANGNCRQPGGRRSAVLAMTASTTPVLGSAAFAPHGGGFGRPHPASFFNGGDPSGYVSKIRWTHWGSATADGTGRNAIFRPEGGYYAQLAVIELRASDRGHCPGSDRLAYRQLTFRVPSRPGGRLGPWRRWSGAKSICALSRPATRTGR